MEELKKPSDDPDGDGPELDEYDLMAYSKLHRFWNILLNCFKELLSL